MAEGNPRSSKQSSCNSKANDKPDNNPFIDCDTLWKEDDLESNYGKQKDVRLPLDIKVQVLSQVQVLLLTVNTNEFWATQSYLKPLEGQEAVYTHHEKTDDYHKSRKQIYHLGLYGKCVAAIVKIDPGSNVRTGAAAAVDMAFKCFRNLAAIIAVGVACGVEGRSKMCEVLVSEQVIGYDRARVEEGAFTSRSEKTDADDYLQQIFKLSKWPFISQHIEKRFSKHSKFIKKRPGIILSGPYLIDDAAYQQILLQNFAKEAKGIEMEGCGLFAAAKGTKVGSIVVKSVCDFGNGSKDKKYQPTAAVFAADCVMHVLNDPQVAETFLPAVINESVAGRSDPGTASSDIVSATAGLSLSKPTLPTLLPWLKRVDNWKLVATELLHDTNGTKINNINKSCQGDVDDCCIKVIQEYMRYGEVTWKKVEESIREAGNKNLADELKKSLKLQ